MQAQKNHSLTITISVFSDCIFGCGLFVLLNRLGGGKLSALKKTDTRFRINRRCLMETRVAVMGIIVENSESVPTLNSFLHEYADYIIGRMGLPYKKRSVSIVSIAIDAPQDVISALTGKIGRLQGVSVKTAYSNVIAYEE